MSCDQDDLMDLMKNEQVEEDQLIDEEMPSEVVHDNITEVVDMDFDGNMKTFMDESQIEMKADDNVMEVDDDENIIMPTSIDQVPKLTPLSGIKFVNTTTGQVTNKKMITLAQAQQLGLVASTKSPTHTSTSQIVASSSVQNQTLLQKKIAGKKIILAPGMLNSMKAPIKIISSNGQNIITQSTVTNSSNISGNNQIDFLVKNSTGDIKPMKQVFVRQPTSAISQPSGKVQIVKIVPNENKNDSFVQTVDNIKTEAVNRENDLRTLQPQTQNSYKLVTIQSGTRQVIAKTASGQQILIPITGGNTMTKLQPTQVLQANSTSGKSNQLIMLPANFLQTQNTNTNQSTPYRSLVNNSQNALAEKKFLKISSNEVKQEYGSSMFYRDSYQESDDDSLHSPSQLQSNGMRQRKPCNCTRSQCLKLYCECFANGEFCSNCNCVKCFNNLKNEEERQKAIKSCLDRNPAAFRPKIGKMRDIDELTNRKHTKGCNCKRSGCLKNYCECYEAKIFCSANCKCYGCRNSEDNTLGRKTFSALQAATESPDIDGKSDQIRKEYSSRPLSYYISLKPSTSFITDDVIEATCHCLLAQAEDTTTRETPSSIIEKMIIEEFGRCLKEIIDYTGGN